MTDITPIIISLIGVFSAIITVVLVPLIRSKTTLSQQLLIQTLINIAVTGAEQIFKGTGLGQDKFNFVLNRINAELAKRHLYYNQTEIELIIESEVRKLNISQGK